MRLKDQVAIVTGAARGLGRSISQALLAEGMQVAMVDISDEALRQCVDELAHDGILPIIADITDPQQVDSFVQHVESTLGPIDLLVNNAGTFSVVGPVWEVDPDKWFRDIRVNLYGTFLMCRAATALMVTRKHGRIINMVSSGGVLDPHPYGTSYASSKTGSMRLTEGLAREVKDYGIQVFAVAPPAIRTGMTQFLMDDAGAQQYRPGVKQIFEDGKDFPPSLISDLVVRLATGDADVLTGRYILPHLGLDAMLENMEAILKEDLWTLRIRRE